MDAPNNDSIADSRNGAEKKNDNVPTLDKARE
jgi:hypothetical protein